MSDSRSHLLLATCFAVTAFVILAQGTSTAGEVPSLVFSARTLRAKYHPREKVMLALRIQNNGKRSVLLAPLSVVDEYVRLRIMGPDGKEIPRCTEKVDGGGLAGQKFVVLRPGAVARALIDLSCDKRMGRGYALGQTGRYVVYAEYHIALPEKSLAEVAGTAVAWNGQIEAEPVEFRIIGQEGESPDSAEKK